MYRHLAVLLLTLITVQASAQSATDIYLVDVQDGIIVSPVDGPLNLTERDGYDNQPFYSDAGVLMYTSMRGEQSDIYLVSFPDLHLEQLTNTPESEYSPTAIPNAAGSFSVIRVESDGTQRLWQFDSEGKSPKLLFPDIKPVGYHAWINSEQVAMFILGDPPTLQVASLADGKASTVAESIGRSLHRIPGSKMISFVHKLSDSDWRIRGLVPDTGTIEDIAPTLPGKEDHAWTPDGSLIMANDSILYRWSQEQNEWIHWYDFSQHGISNITRLAVSPKGGRLVIVADH